MFVVVQFENSPAEFLRRTSQTLFVPIYKSIVIVISEKFLLGVNQSETRIANPQKPYLCHKMTFKSLENTPTDQQSTIVLWLSSCRVVKNVKRLTTEKTPSDGKMSNGLLIQYIYIYICIHDIMSYFSRHMLIDRIDIFFFKE